MAEPQKVTKIRMYAPQIVACIIKNSLLFTIGTSYAFFTIIIAAASSTHPHDPINLDLEESSWFASIFFLFPILGSLISGELTDRYGRKLMLILSNIPHIISWILFYFVDRIELMYFGSALLGFGIGFMEAPVVTYMGELAQPQIRAVLVGLTSVAVQLGIWTSFGLNKSIEWRKISIISLACPIFSMISIVFIPEMPYWLIAKNRNESALKSLQWLRGWVRPEAVQEEFNAILRYSENMNRCPECIKANIHCIHLPLKFKQKYKELRQPKNLKVLILIIALFAFAQLGGYLSMRPYIGMVFGILHIPISIEDAIFYLGMIGFISVIVSLCTIHYTGKRIACIISYSFIIASFLTLAIYDLFRLHAEKSTPNYVPLIAIYFLCFFSGIGCTTIGWFLVSEITPLRLRGIVGGFAAGANYLLAFFGTKIFPEIEESFTLNGAFWYFLVVNILAIIFVLFLLPETENRTLEEIEEHFSRKGLWKTKIQKYSSVY